MGLSSGYMRVQLHSLGNWYHRH